MIPATDALAKKLLLGRYRVVQLLGEGGMGTVHLARVEGAEGFTRPVVVKRMRRDVRGSEEGNRLFIREAKILSKMQHPGIVGIIDFGVEDGAHIMVLEYVHGYTLSPWLDYRKQQKLPLPVGVCLFIVRRILDALHYAHHFDTEEGREIEIVHRDVAPDNVLLSNKGYVHLLDFGVASMRGPEAGSTRSGTFRGKLGYAAPETVLGEPATPRADQYSAAVLLLELLTLETPFVSDSMGETVVRMVNEIPKPPSAVRGDIPSGLDQALARALSKLAGERFESSLAFSRQLRRFQASDDEEVAQELKELVRADFEALPEAIGVEPLKMRDLALSQLAPAESAGIASAPGTAPVKIRSAGTEARTHAGLSSSSAENKPAASLAPAQRQLHRLLFGLLIVGGMIAVGLGASVALLSRGGGDAEQVVVVGGERQDPASRENPTNHYVSPSSPSGTENVPRSTPASAAAGDLHSVAGEGEPAEPPKVAGQKSVTSPGPTLAPSPTPDPALRERSLSEAVQQKSGAFQSCFAGHLEDAEKQPEARLHFSVAAEGGSAQVRVEPQSLATTALGSCLARAGNQVTFPALGEPVAFRVPVRARVARLKDKP